MRLEIRDLCFSYPKQETIKNVSFTAVDGDIVAILGVNGVGKSTMLKCINKVHKPKSGRIILDGKNLLDMKTNEIAKVVGYVAQYGQFGEGSVFDNVLLGRKPFIKWDISANDLDIVNNVIKSVGLDHLADRNIDKLSGGERQKVAICRALAQQTPVLMFDEPTSNLDVKNQLEVLNVIKDIVLNNKLIALISIHDINLALRYANKFLLLKNGEVYLYGDESIITKESVKNIYGVDCEISTFKGHKYVIID